MDRSAHYDSVKKAVEEAVDHIRDELDGNYRGYTGANAVSLYINDKHGINVTCDNEADRAFKDVLDHN